MVRTIPLCAYYLIRKKNEGMCDLQIHDPKTDLNILPKVSWKNGAMLKLKADYLGLNSGNSLSTPALVASSPKEDIKDPNSMNCVKKFQSWK
jgi:hypothetical protein